MIETMENDKNLYIFSNGIKINKQVLEKYPDLFNYFLEYETDTGKHKMPVVEHPLRGQALGCPPTNGK